MDKQLIDFKIFLNKDINEECTDSKDCKSVHRVITALVYYQRLNERKTENSNGQSIFTQLLLEAYTHYLDDITHILTKHDSQIQNMHTLLLQKSHFMTCDIDKCLSPWKS